ncbi:MFS transporter [Flavobacteriaceae bacterium PRS1]|nr:MFS transporter [Flavobacteriaceae bacterium PRS1]
MSKTKQPIYVIILLILSGEAVFILPFVLVRIFRPTFLEVFDINNLQLGTCFSIYGIVALFSYIFGGPLADKYHPRYLISVSLILTSIGGIYLSTYPDYSHLKYLYGFWGFTTIFLFWSALIKATRIWGGTKKQGMAFGFLDGGRGLVAAVFGTVGILIFSLFIDVDISETSLIERKEAFSYVILYSSVIVSIIGVLSFYLLKPLQVNETLSKQNSSILTIYNFKQIMKIPSVWLLMIIILCAYVGYKVTDIFSLYAKDVMLYDDIESAKVGTSLLYMRPVIGVVIGLLADKTRASLWIIIGFFLTLITSLIFATGIISEHSTLLFGLSIGLMALGVYSVRVLYFATMQEGKIPLVLTGTAVGFISIVGYTPDIFSGPMIGVLLDNSPGELGHQHVFLVLAGFTLIGLITSIVFYRISKKIIIE